MTYLLTWSSTDSILLIKVKQSKSTEFIHINHLYLSFIQADKLTKSYKIETNTYNRLVNKKMTKFHRKQRMKWELIK